MSVPVLLRRSGAGQPDRAFCRLGRAAESGPRALPAQAAPVRGQDQHIISEQQAEARKRRAGNRL